MKLCTRGGLRGTPLGLLAPPGERGGHPHNNRGLPNNSKITDFSRAKIQTVLFFCSHKILRNPICTDRFCLKKYPGKKKRVSQG
jgi:hypothetical protein